MARNSSGAFRPPRIASREFLPIGRPISPFPIVMPPPRWPSSLAEDFICLPPISKMSDECPSSPIRRAPRSPSSRRPRGPPAPEPALVPSKQHIQGIAFPSLARRGKIAGSFLPDAILGGQSRSTELFDRSLMKKASIALLVLLMAALPFALQGQTD